MVSNGLQVHGGSGFTEEWGASQLLRDARITLIYEGTNGVQALDLVGRKLAMDGGKPIKKRRLWGGFGVVLGIVLAVFVFGLDRKEDEQVPVAGPDGPIPVEVSPEVPETTVENAISEAEREAEIARAEAAAHRDAVRATMSAYSMQVLGADRFEMGLERGDPDEKPVREKSLNRFSIGRKEVTQAIWSVVMEQNPSCVVGDELPVTNVTYNEVMTFIARVNEATGKTFRLPTEAEWEYAAKEDKKWFTNTTTKRKKRAWYLANSGGKPHPVGTMETDDQGLYDMLGNVWEWCADYYSVSYYADSPEHNPTGPEDGEQRVVRGGAFDTRLTDLRPEKRRRFDPDTSDCSIGFRLALSDDPDSP